MLKMWLRRFQSREEGLTLIELIVVVAIIAILAFTITPRVLDALNNSKLNSARSLASELHAAMERYYTNAGTGSSSPQYLESASIADVKDLTTALGSTVSTNNADKNVKDFSWESNTSNDQSYCFYIQAADSKGTYLMVQPKGVTESTSTPTSCPLN